MFAAAAQAICEGQNRPTLKKQASSSPADLRVGFVELVDAAPLVAALELGYFADEGLRVVLDREIGWGNVRDKLVYGHLQAGHALVGMPPLSVLGRSRFPEVLTSIMALGAGGNAITFGRRLTDAGITSAADLARYAHSKPAPVPVLLAHVFDCSMHHYLLREWLAQGGVNMESNVRFCVLPPNQMTRQLGRGTLDGFCCGEPWNTLAEQEGLGQIVAATTEVLPDHPEKVLAVSRRWLASSGPAAEALIRATIRGCAYCADAANYPALAEMLAKPAYLHMREDIVLKSLTIDRWLGGASRKASGPIRNCSPAMTFPAATHGAWILSQMARWNHLSGDIDPVAVALEAVNSGPYRRAAAALGIACPPDDLPPMRLRTGWYSPKAPLHATQPKIPGARPIEDDAEKTSRAVARQGA
jgi:nitrate/nitrite transport system substrate-binding protein